MADVYLTPITADGEGERVLLEDVIEIGRSDGHFQYPDDAFVSGRHARVHRVHGQVTLEDLGSTNGTFIRVNGELELRPGDTVRIGSQLFRFLV